MDYKSINFLLILYPRLYAGISSAVPIQFFDNLSGGFLKYFHFPCKIFSFEAEKNSVALQYQPPVVVLHPAKGVRWINSVKNRLKKADSKLTLQHDNAGSK